MNETNYYKFQIIPSSTTATVRDFREAAMGENGNFALLDKLLAGIEIRKCEVVQSNGVYSLVFTKLDGTAFTVALPAFSADGSGGTVSVVTPVITAEETETGVMITIADGNGSKSTELKNGVDGVSPTAKVEQTVTGALITITDKNGTTSAVVNHGTSTTEDGAVINGFSPIAVVEQTDAGAVITITDANGTTSASINHGKDASIVVDSSVTDGGTNAVNSAAVISYVDTVLGDFEAAAAQMDALIGG